ncbi:histidine phosphatase family protein [Bacillus infantis]|uniref:histidine phosphatase family protein n=1 Tax=Bacillus infantis TaxID=324767 RepID=UPI002FBE6988
MKTYIYMVRHGESPKENENERSRGLTEKGKRDAQKVCECLLDEGVNMFASSPYQRAVQTIEGAAARLNKDIHVFEDLKERVFLPDEAIISKEKLLPLLERSFSDPDYTLPGGESNRACQDRATRILLHLIRTNQGRRIAIGTHGAVMTLMMGKFSREYGLGFLLSSSKPDLYKLEFNGIILSNVTRLYHV